MPLLTHVLGGFDFDIDLDIDQGAHRESVIYGRDHKWEGGYRYLY